MALVVAVVMLAKVLTEVVHGVDSFAVEVEVHITPAGPMARNLFIFAGLPDAAVRESKERVRAAMSNSGWHYPRDVVTVNLAPADMRKEGPGLDLPIALAILAATGRVSADRLADWCAVGELALDGNTRPVSGALAMALGARQRGRTGILVPAANAQEAAMAQGIDVVPVSTLQEAASFLNGSMEIVPTRLDIEAVFRHQATSHSSVDFSEVCGQENAKRALEIAAAGGHNALLVGPPGSGKTMLAKRLPTILPEMTPEESLEATKIHSVAGTSGARHGLVAVRPFRSPHHTASHVAMIGGGSVPRPGEVSLAHHGVLYLDEMPEFPRAVLEVLRQPLEDGQVTVARAAMTLTFPARFIMIGSMNPCPCGFAGDIQRSCSCLPQAVQRYVGRLSGPLLDRIDLHVEVPAVPVAELARKRTASAEPSAAIRARVEAARALQRDRYHELPNVHCNAHLSGRELRKFAPLDDEASNLLVRSLERLGLSARAYDRVVKVARTIADLAESDEIHADHVAEAINYRTLDRPGRGAGGLDN